MYYEHADDIFSPFSVQFRSVFYCRNILVVVDIAVTVIVHSL